jgi:hypothetical protein
MFTGTPWLVVTESGFATGASFTGATVIVTVPVAVSVPSLRVYVNVT